MGNNPLLVTEGLPRYNEITPEHIVPGVKEVLEEAEKQIAALEENLTPCWDGLLVPLEEIDVPFSYAWSPVAHLMSVKNSDALREAHEAVLQDVVAFGLRMEQSRPIYEGLVAIRDGEEWAKLDGVQQRCIELRIRSAEHAGVGLEGEAKERFNEIAKEKSQMSTDFSNHVLDATKVFELVIEDKAETEGWPNSLRQVAAQSYVQANEGREATPEEGPWRITLDFPSFYPFMQHHRVRDHREQVYKAYVKRASSGELDNSGLIAQTLKLRKEQAALLGFGTFAEWSLDSKMAPDVAAVERMVGELQAASKAHMEIDFGEQQALAKENGQEEPVMHWDTPFWSERLREQKFDYTDDQLRPYFPLPKVLDGLFGLAERLFDIEIQRADDEDAPRWHEDVQFFKVIRDGERIASFYLDPYSRPAEKRGGAWMNECLGRQWLNGKLRLPVVHLICNGTPPVGDTPSLMSFDEVTTLFHEFGHGLQGMLTTVDYADVAGLHGVEWDAVEIASQFMENWCYHKPTLIGMTAHVETGDPLPDDLFDKIVAARTFQAGSLMMRQLSFGKTDMLLHSAFDPEGDETAFDVERKVSEEMSVLPPLPESRFLCSFSHIFAGGYAAGYYSYKWSEVLSADAFGAFEDVGLDDEDAVKVTGCKFRDTILAQGGSKHPMDVYREFRGREPSTEALLRHNGLL
ncbi:MAG: M3 family metallopeptidase [Candidatus Latescibacteria bacterium]|nr:M3 family metallopeptidase [Candidatus Latescibacterota bacterium]